MVDRDRSEESLAVVVLKKNAQLFRQILEASGVWDKNRRLKCLGLLEVAIPVLDDNQAKAVLDKSPQLHDSLVDFRIVNLDLPCSKTAVLKTPYEKMVEGVKSLMMKSNIQLSACMLRTIPRHWEVHGDLVLLPSGSFDDVTWTVLGKELWLVVGNCLGCDRVARKHTIATDGFRSPRVELLLGDCGWVEHIDNGIKYAYDITRCMFSAGNVTEKLRVSHFDCTGETVLDLYAGIGYFTLPYLVHAKAELVHACEWNPAAVEALRKNLILNGVQEKCVIHVGDNRQVCPKGIADRVNLGLIPSSRSGWHVACAALKPTGGMLHIHSNVTACAHGQGRAETSNNMGEKHVDETPGDYETKSNVRQKECVAKDNIHHSLGGIIEDFSHNTCGRDTDLVETGDCPGFQRVSSDGILPEASTNLRSKRSVKNIHTVGNQSCPTQKQSGRPAFPYWLQWAKQTSSRMEEILFCIYGKPWRTQIHHIEHVKSYAPHVDHVVLDLECRPE